MRTLDPWSDTPALLLAAVSAVLDIVVALLLNLDPARLTAVLGLLGLLVTLVASGRTHRTPPHPPPPSPLTVEVEKSVEGRPDHPRDARRNGTDAQRGDLLGCRRHAADR
jgi:hypothetical protein